METPSELPDVELYDWLTQKQVLLAYNGEIDGELIDMLVQLAEKALKKASSKPKVRKKIVNILIESLQNSFHYTQDIQNEPFENISQAIKSPFLILCKEVVPTIASEEGEPEITVEITAGEDVYWVTTGNWIDDANVEKLNARIQLLENLSHDELQAYYIQSLNKEVLPTQGGAGLGLIDIMRRADRQVFFQTKKIAQDFSVFMLKIKVN